MLRLLIAILALLATPLLAQETVVAALSQNRVAITATYSGSEIFIFGAVKRESPLAEGLSQLEVAIVVEGPLERVTVRKKAKKLGIWVNTDSIEVDMAPSFFTVATTGPLNEILHESVREDFSIGMDFAVRRTNRPNGRDIESFNEAVTRIRHAEGLYSERENIINLTSDTLFNARILLPANLVEGDYTAKIFLIRDQNIISQTAVDITVRKEGLERWLYKLAHENALLYGLMSLAVALIAGYGASEIFRRLRA